MENILKNIINDDKHQKYTQYKLNKIYSIDKNLNNLKILLKEFDFKKDTKFFVTKTLQIDSINVIDIDKTKFIEFENDLYEFTNKGMQNSYEIYLD